MNISSTNVCEVDQSNSSSSEDNGDEHSNANVKDDMAGEAGVVYDIHRNADDSDYISKQTIEEFIALFFLKLQCKYHIPASTIQLR
jgi:hypothetical protein